MLKVIHFFITHTIYIESKLYVLITNQPPVCQCQSYNFAHHEQKRANDDFDIIARYMPSIDRGRGAAHIQSVVDRFS